MKCVVLKVNPGIDAGDVLASFVSDGEEIAAIYVGTDKKLQFYDYESALYALDDFPGKYEVCNIGDTEYVLLYSDDSTVLINGERYILGECMIMKIGNRIERMSKKDISSAFNQFVSRVVALQAGAYQIHAYRM